MLQRAALHGILPHDERQHVEQQLRPASVLLDQAELQVRLAECIRLFAPSQSADSRGVGSSATRLDDTCLGSPGHPPCTGVFTSGVLSRALPKKYLLLDDRNVISSNATLVLGKVTKHKAGALIKEDKPWEMRKSYDCRWHPGDILARVPAVSLPIVAGRIRQHAA